LLFKNEAKMTKQQGVNGEKLTYSPKFAWDLFTNEQKDNSRDFARDYLIFLRKARTERERTQYAEYLAKEADFHELKIGKNITQLKPGDKIYYKNRNKNIALIIVGSNPISEESRFIGAHMDTPRIDLKIRPFYEDEKSGVALCKTHYYGGVKKYQWASIPLALTGVIVKLDGETIEIDIGTHDEDPVFTIPDLAPHLNKTIQSKRTTNEVIKAKEMNVLVAGIKSDEKDAKERFKLKVLEILNNEFNISESDFLSADLSFVPAMPPRLLGFDKSMIGGAGQDDGACSYVSLRSIIDKKEIPPFTIITGLFDKEEIGSNGNTGAQSVWINQIYNDLIVRTGLKESNTNLNLALMNTKMLSSDTTAAMDPSFKSVHDPQTASIFGKGITIMKYTGSRGKYGSSDAGAEYSAYIRNIFEINNVPYQFGTIGQVDAGGGGTIAKFFAERFNSDVVDAGPGVMNMHSPYEITHIADIFSTYLAFSAFFN
jgi:aspartyl aminopeptidase